MDKMLECLVLVKIMELVLMKEKYLYNRSVKD